MVTFKLKSKNNYSFFTINFIFNAGKRLHLFPVFCCLFLPPKLYFLKFKTI